MGNSDFIYLDSSVRKKCASVLADAQQQVADTGRFPQTAQAWRSLVINEPWTDVHGSHSAQKTGLNLGLFQVLIDVILGDQDERDHRRFIEFAPFNRRFNNVDPGGELSHAVLKDGRA